LNEQDHIIETFTEMASRYESLMNSELNRFWGVSYQLKRLSGDAEALAIRV
jgi:hypothetical protein